MFDTELWVGIIALTALLYGFKWFITKQRSVKVYRISPQSLQRSKTVIMAVLPLVEDESTAPLDEALLRYSKDDIKSAAKIMAYYFWRKKRYAELTRIKNCFVAISRFQNKNLDLESQKRRVARERKQLGRELDHYMTHSPFNASRRR
ncbi:hypothetical protein [Pseudodesulfovibrio sediminis]|uniref:DUF4760 domain-containing protein n=1 Tax=Pseudodesulfovibrio sediminis TaxID=2810563 RepID=A0ABN6ETL1_9BACT|nr:hypothetical protein [Pseudodesulfovibrio sediminis]BCS88570.1 hypothetical protein PSDVSF_18120 [Pseudodesulfovibrio sediminis]